MINDIVYMRVKREIIDSNLHTFFKDGVVDEMDAEERELVSYVIGLSGDINLAKRMLKNFKRQREAWRYAI